MVPPARRTTSSTPKVNSKDAKSKIHSVSKDKPKAKADHSSSSKTTLKTKRNTEMLIESLDASLPDLLNLTSKMKVKKAAFGVLEKQRKTGPNTKQLAQLKTEDDLESALDMLGSL